MDRVIRTLHLGETDRMVLGVRVRIQDPGGKYAITYGQYPPRDGAIPLGYSCTAGADHPATRVITEGHQDAAPGKN